MRRHDSEGIGRDAVWLVRPMLVTGRRLPKAQRLRRYTRLESSPKPRGGEISALSPCGCKESRYSDTTEIVVQLWPQLQDTHDDNWDPSCHNSLG
jgi:hypothetical protein